MSEIDAMRQLKSFLGMSEEAAKIAITDLGFRVRVVMRDGSPFMVTQDLRMDRVNLTIADGIVTEAHFG